MSSSEMNMKRGRSRCFSLLALGALINISLTFLYFKFEYDGFMDGLVDETFRNHHEVNASKIKEANNINMQELNLVKMYETATDAKPQGGEIQSSVAETHNLTIKNAQRDAVNMQEIDSANTQEIITAKTKHAEIQSEGKTHNNLTKSVSNLWDDETKYKISYRIVKGLQLQQTFNPYVTCEVGKRRKPLYPHLANNGIFDFHTQIITNLRIIVIGDSVGIQMSQALEEAVGADLQNRHVLRYTWGEHEGISVANPTIGGGAVAGFRITGLLARNGEDKKNLLPNNFGGGWMRSDVDEVMGRLAAPNVTSSGWQNFSKSDDQAFFDVVVHQPPAGWMDKPWVDTFTPYNLSETVQLSHELFGARTVVFQTVFISNNVEEIGGDWAAVNRAIFDFAHNYEPPADGSGVRRIMVLDMGSLSLRLFQENVDTIGLAESIKQQQNRSSTDQHQQVTEVDYNAMLKHRLSFGHKIYKPSIGLVCAETVEPGTKKCIRNFINIDGMHWCMETIGGRLNAGLACLLRCVYNSNETKQGIIDCETRCNSRYMSLKPVQWENKTIGILHNYV